MRIAIEGNLGSGKSELLAALALEFPGVPVFAPPPPEHRHALQRALAQLLAYQGAYEAETCLVEGSPLGCRHVFAQLLFGEGALAPGEWDLFKEYHDVLGWVPDAILYIETPIGACVDRLKTRGDDTVDEAQLRRIEYKYDLMLKYCTAPVVRLDGTSPGLATEAARRIRGLLPASSWSARASTSCSPSSTAA